MRQVATGTQEMQRMQCQQSQGGWQVCQRARQPALTADACPHHSGVGLPPVVTGQQQVERCFLAVLAWHRSSGNLE